MLRIGFALAVVLTASACSPAAPAGPAVEAGSHLTMQVDNSMHFTPTAIALKSGQPLEVTVDNVGGMTHDFSLSEGVAQPVKLEAASGQQASGTITLDRPGAYTFVCSQPGHALAGMKGTIVVS
jgi:plastocyanin